VDRECLRVRDLAASLGLVSQQRTAPFAMTTPEAKARFARDWGDRTEAELARRAAGTFWARLPVGVADDALTFLSRRDLGAAEATCRFLSLRRLSRSSRDRLRRATSCHALRRALVPKEHVVDSYVEGHSDVETLVADVGPTVFEAYRRKQAKQPDRVLWPPSLTSAASSDPSPNARRFWTAYWSARAQFCRSCKGAKEKKKKPVPDLFALDLRPNAMLALFQLARASLRGGSLVFPGMELWTLVEYVEEAHGGSLDGEMDRLVDEQATRDEWVAALNERRRFAGVELEILLFLAELLRQPERYTPESMDHHDLRERTCFFFHTLYRSSTESMGGPSCPVVVSLAQHFVLLQKSPAFSGALTTDLPGDEPTDPGEDERRVEAWQEIFQNCQDWLRVVDEQFGYACHLRLHQILAKDVEEDGPVAGLDPLNIQSYSCAAFLVTTMLRLGSWRSMAKLFQSTDDVRHLLADYRAMLDAYRRCKPIITRVYLDSLRRNGFSGDLSAAQLRSVANLDPSERYLP